MTAISVVECDRVLAIFDDTTRGQADEVLGDIIAAATTSSPALAWLSG